MSTPHPINAPELTPQELDSKFKIEYFYLQAVESLLTLTQREPISLETEAWGHFSNDLRLLHATRYQTNVFEYTEADGTKGATLCRYFCQVVPGPVSEEHLREFCEQLVAADTEGLLSRGVLLPVTAVPLHSRPGNHWALAFFAGSECDHRVLKEDTQGLAMDEHELPAEVLDQLYQAIGENPAACQAKRDLTTHMQALRINYLHNPDEAYAAIDSARRDFLRDLDAGAAWYRPTPEFMADHGFQQVGPSPRLYVRPGQGPELARLSVHYHPFSGRVILQYAQLTEAQVLHAGQVRNERHLAALLQHHGFSTFATNAR